MFALTPGSADGSSACPPAAGAPARTSRPRPGLRPHVAWFFLAILFLFSPAARAQTPLLLGDLDADNRPTVLDLQRLINHLNGTNLLPASLRPWADINEDGRLDTNDVLRLQKAVLGLDTLPNPYAAPVLNALVAATNGSNLLITGIARPNRQILVTGGRFAVFAVSDSNGQFSATVQLRPNQLNNLFVTASSSNFVAGIPQPLRVLQDSQPPNLFIDFPTNGATLTPTAPSSPAASAIR